MNAQLPPDDPRLTAYALGELDADERAAVEAALRADPAARATVEQIRALGAQLTDALAHEPAPEVEARPITPAPAAAKLIRFPQLYYVVGALAAACFALLIALRTPPPVAAPKPIAAETKARAAAPENAPAKEMTVQLRVAPAAEAEREAARKSLADAAAAAAAKKEVAAANAVADSTIVAAPAPAPVAQAKDKAADEVVTLQKFEVAESQPAAGVRANSLASAQRVQTAVQVEPPALAPAATAEVQQTGALSDQRDRDARVRTFPPDEKIVAQATVPATPVANNSIIDAKVPATPAFEKSVVRAEPTRPTTTTVGGTIAGATPLIQSPAGGALTFSADATARARTATPAIAGTGTSILAPAPTLAPSNELVPLNSFVGGATPADLQTGVATLATGRRTDTRRPLAVGWRDNGFVSPLKSPLSTFAMSVDTSSYSAVRRFLQLKRMPPPDAVRIEELVNYFPYRYAPPKGEAPFAASMEVTEAPWAPDNLLVRIGLKAREVASAARPPANLAIVIDALDTDRVKNHLPMIKASVQNLIGKLHPDDRVALVTCEGNGRIALPPTPVAQAREILRALDALTPATSSRRVQGIQLGYDLLQSHFQGGATNRVLFCTDGNSGVTVLDEERLLRYIDDRAKAGVGLAAFGYGLGIYRDELLDLLLRYRTGSYGYLDWQRDIENALVEDVNGAPVTIAKDVNVQVEFNPAKVASYRLIGYDNRELKKDDFPADAFETDEVGAGHAFTALFEIVPTASAPAALAERPPADGLRYQPSKRLAAAGIVIDPNELLNVKVNYKKPGGAIPHRLEVPLADARTQFVNASADFKFAAAIAGFGMILRESPYRGSMTFGDVLDWAEAANTDDPGGYRGEFIGLAREAQALTR